MTAVLRLLSVCVCLVGLAACQTTTQSVRTVAVDPTATVGEQPVSVARAITAFNAVCGQSLPNFRNASGLMAQQGVTNRASTGTVFSPSENLSFRISDGPGNGQTCSIAFGSAESQRAVMNAYEQAFGPLRLTPLGLTAGYPNHRALVLVGNNARNGNITYYSLRLLSER